MTHFEKGSDGAVEAAVDSVFVCVQTTAVKPTRIKLFFFLP